MIDGKVLVTGSNGQLASCIKDVINSITHNNSDKYIFTTRKEFDTTNYEMMEEYIKSNQDIKVIINCAAYTDVKGAETDEGFQRAMDINCDGVKNLAHLCNKYDIFLIHIGTDYMYGLNVVDYTHPIVEEKVQWLFSDDWFMKYYGDKANYNRYGYSKAMGIHELFKEFKYEKNDKKLKFVVIVVSWLYSYNGKNFVKSIREKLKTDEEINVVYTQVGSPTYALDLANYIVDVIENDNCVFIDNPYDYNVATTMSSNYWHIINFANLGVASWYDMAKKVEDFYCLHNDKIQPITSFSDGVMRLRYSVLDTSKLLKRKNNKEYVRHWLDALDSCLHMIRRKELDENEKE